MEFRFLDNNTPIIGVTCFVTFPTYVQDTSIQLPFNRHLLSDTVRYLDLKPI